MNNALKYNENHQIGPSVACSEQIFHIKSYYFALKNFSEQMTIRKVLLFDSNTIIITVVVSLPEPNK